LNVCSGAGGGSLGDPELDARRVADLADVEPRHFWFRARAGLLAWTIGSYFTEARSFLEIGSGTGFTLSEIRRRLPHLRLTGSDPSAAATAAARQRLPDVDFLRFDAGDIPYQDEFDVVGAFDVLEHIDDDEAALRQMWRALRPGGGVVLTVPQHPGLWSAVDEYARHRRRYTRRDLSAMVKRAGFRISRTTSFCSALLPVLAVSRLRQRQLTHDFDPLTECRPGRFANVALEAVLRIESAVIRSGVSLPAGGSLLVVARRGAA
jgi:SAM-dependent methyltransferase